jgi:hypothetical protein
MAEILKILCAMILFLSLFLVATEAGGRSKPFFILFKFQFLLRSSYTIICNFLVKLLLLSFFNYRIF